jgi:hypothetical protein
MRQVGVAKDSVTGESLGYAMIRSVPHTWFGVTSPLLFDRTRLNLRRDVLTMLPLAFTCSNGLGWVARGREGERVAGKHKGVEVDRSLLLYAQTNAF